MANRLAKVIGLVLLAVCGTSSLIAADAVQMVKGEDTVAITIDGAEFATYHFGSQWAKPFLYPVKSATGKPFTRSLEAPDSKDHPHHKGVWCAIDEVNDLRFWAELATIKNVGLELVRPEGDPAILKVTNHWLGTDGQPVVIEVEHIAIYADRLVTYDLNFTAGAAPVTWGDTKEGLFGIRVADTMRETKGGQIVNAEGLKATKDCWGKFSDWVDYTGDIGGEVGGVAVMDHPLNFRRSRYHVRDYGLFTLSPFGNSSYTNGAEPEQPLVQAAGSSFRLRYGLYFHAGTAAEAHVADKYLEFLKRRAQ